MFYVILYDIKHMTKNSFILAGDDTSQFRYRSKSSGGTKAVCTVSEAAKRLSKSPRQIYRYIESGVLLPAGKVLNEWLIPLEEVTRLQKTQTHIHPIPKRLGILFPDYRLKDLNAGRDRILLMARILEQGNQFEIGWLLRRFPKNEFIAFLRENGSLRLSAKALRFWCLYFGVDVSAESAVWRKRDNPWQ